MKMMKKRQSEFSYYRPEAVAQLLEHSTRDPLDRGFESRFKIRLGLFSKKFQKCLINYLGLSYEQTVTSQLYLLVNHHRDNSSLLQSM
jgi:hypothetical protein